jgi:hypothetical protein
MFLQNSRYVTMSFWFVFGRYICLGVASSNTRWHLSFTLLLLIFLVR